MVFGDSYLPFCHAAGLHLRGSHFFAFSYTSIALATLIVTLLFFAAPSKSARVLAATSALLLPGEHYHHRGRGEDATRRGMGRHRQRRLYVSSPRVTVRD